jgi:diacylglycerol kinase (ATP)
MKQDIKARKTKPFSLQERGSSFGYAWQGVRAFFATEHNAWLHLIATAGAMIMALFFPVSGSEAALLVLASGAVWAAELFNTAIEKMMDYQSVERDPSIKFIKDLAAGAVLITALSALLAGLFVFIPKL